MGDKSQLTAMAFAARYRPWPVLTAIAVATAGVHAVSVGVGYGLGLALPTAWIALAGGCAFLGFAVWTLRPEGEEPEETAGSRVGRSVLVGVATTFFLSELGDKTMLASLTLAATDNPVAVWGGAAAGMIAADGLAILIGYHLGRRLPQRTIRLAAAALFAVFGVALLIRAVTALV
ncbi:TMEM165/GDT1 family protein [Longispora sp. K20-0274]|uniref:TMEM165/GDT1 family protein n=1 Tax=Longispora sp. K20-0274 TaxID=3088255 RepID=UPI0039999D75